MGPLQHQRGTTKDIMQIEASLEMRERVRVREDEVASRQRRGSPGLVHWVLDPRGLGWRLVLSQELCAGMAKARRLRRWRRGTFGRACEAMPVKTDLRAGSRGRCGLVCADALDNGSQGGWRRGESSRLSGGSRHQPCEAESLRRDHGSGQAARREAASTRIRRLADVSAAHPIRRTTERTGAAHPGRAPTRPIWATCPARGPRRRRAS